MLNKRRLNLAILLIALLVCAPRTSAQNPTPTPEPSPAPTPSPMPWSVKLNVRVLETWGALVGDLKQEDFQVLEDGVAQPITSFAHEQWPVSYALVVDNTGSMRPQLELMFRASATVAAGNSPGDETSVVRFVDSEKIEMLQPFTAEQSKLLSALREMYIEGGQSAIIDAVFISAHYVVEHSQTGDRRRALVLVTDGEDRDSFYKLDALLKYLRSVDVQVFVIGLVGELDKQETLTRSSSQARAVKLLDTLAEETGGHAFYPNKLEEVKQAVAALTAELHTQYIIGYTPTNQARDKKYRKVQVKLAAKPGAGKRTVLTRAGYVVVYDAPPARKTSNKKSEQTP